MEYIDEKFKAVSPEETVKTIKTALEAVNIDTYEYWHDSGVENCYSLTLRAGNGLPSSNGKGISKAFAQASAYGEFIERLQSGLFFYKYQSFECDPEVNLQCYAPDGKYFTAEELGQDADWINFIVESYPGLTKEALLAQFRMYAHTDDGKILCVPFYSLFEDKYVYLPTGFIEHIYSANGCCAGNTKEEALIHAFSEIMERKGDINAITNGDSFPEIPESVLQTFPRVSQILTQLRQSDDLDVKIFDCSIGNGFPVVSTRIINKTSHGYIVNFAADPILEIAIQRTLTEIFQGRNIKTIASTEVNKPILSSLSGMRSATNILNQLEKGKGLFTVDFFAEELTCNKTATRFEDNSGLTNSQLLRKIVHLYKQLGKPVFVRNYNFLGFPCYKVIIPGFSESRGMKLTEPVQEYEIGHIVSQVLRYPQKADVSDFAFVFLFKKMIAKTLSRENNFNYLSGMPLDQTVSYLLLNVTLAYCAYMMGNQKAVIENVNALCNKSTIEVNDKQYFECVRQYLHFKSENIPNDKIFCVLDKLHKRQYVEQLKNSLANGTPFDEYLLKCDTKNCNHCRYKNNCHYDYIKKLIHNVGAAYSKFTDGQNPKNFIKV